MSELRKEREAAEEGDRLGRRWESGGFGVVECPHVRARTHVRT